MPPSRAINSVQAEILEGILASLYPECNANDDQLATQIRTLLARCYEGHRLNGFSLPFPYLTLECSVTHRTGSRCNLFLWANIEGNSLNVADIKELALSANRISSLVETLAPLVSDPENGPHDYSTKCSPFERATPKATRVPILNPRRTLLKGEAPSRRPATLC